MTKLTDIRAALAILGLQLAVGAIQRAGLAPSVAPDLERISFRANIVLVLAGLVTLLAFYAHAVTVIGNRTPVWRLYPIWRFLLLTKPLEILLRFLTAPLRCTPDVMIIGEVRCGTTTLSTHLRNLPGATGPFCAFDHPLDGKESFYFSGHYFGLVHPFFYRAMFPLKATRWLHTEVLGQPFLVFDGCAQYLTSPWAPAMVQAAVGPDVRFMACLREPVSQNLSWWRYEHGAIEWFNQMGIPNDVTGIAAARTADYPPGRLIDAFELSRSPTVSKWYAEAGSSATALRWFLPPRLITWPNGQLSATSRNGDFATNLRRWLDVFPRSRFEYFEVTELSSDLPGVLDRICAALPAWYPRGLARKVLAEADVIHANPSAKATGTHEPTKGDLARLGSYYRPKNEALFELIGRRYDGWHRMSYYQTVYH